MLPKFVSPFGWSKRYGAAVARAAEQAENAVINVLRHAHIMKQGYARQLAAGEIDQTTHDDAVAEMELHVESILAEQEKEEDEPAPVSIGVMMDPEPAEAVAEQVEEPKEAPRRGRPPGRKS